VVAASRVIAAVEATRVALTQLL